MIIHDLLLPCPHVIKEAVHYPDGLFPDELIVRLEQSSINLAAQESVVPLLDASITIMAASSNEYASIVALTSENAGAVTLRYRFHSSPSEATMLRPKNDSAPYWSTGLTNRVRRVVIS